MLFSSITFLYYFLPMTLLIYIAVPEKWKNAVLLAASFLFYFWGEPKYCLLMAVTVLTGYLGGIVIEGAAGDNSLQQKKAGCMPAVVFAAVILSFLFVFKYADFVIQSINDAAGAHIPSLKLALPVGISFYTFQIVSYLVDVYRKDIRAERSLIRFAAYVTMFPQLIAGPIVRYASIENEMRTRKLSADSILEGCSRFACGLAKKVLVADVLSELVAKLDAAEGKGTVAYWILTVSFALQIYYDFSGYSDMAIGLGRMLGFTFPENFNYPFIAKSITEFWRRWHMTLSGWFRDYVYIPLGGNRVPCFRFIFNVFAVWFLSGLWHGAGWNFALWGLYFAVFLILEKLSRKITLQFKSETELKRNGVLKKLISVLGHVYTLLVVTVSFVLFREEQLFMIWENFQGMFLSGGWVKESAAVWYELKSYTPMLAAAVIGATPFISKLLAAFGRWKPAKNSMELLRLAVTIIFIAASTSFLIGSSAHPFLYFRF